MTSAGDERALVRSLVSALAHRDDVLVLPVFVPAGADMPPIHPLTVLLLARLHQRTVERDAFRSWVTQDPVPPSDNQLRTHAAEAASNLARKDSP